MKNVLIAIDDSKGAEKTVQVFLKMYSCAKPEKVTLLFVEKIEGRSLMDEMLGDAEMETLKEMLVGTEYQDRLDKRAAAILAHFGDMLKENGGNYSKQEDWNAHVVADGLLITGQNPASSEPAALALLAKLA